MAPAFVSALPLAHSRAHATPLVSRARSTALVSHRARRTLRARACATPPPGCPDDASDAAFGYALLGSLAAACPTGASAGVPQGVKDAFGTIPVSLAHPAAMWAMFGLAVYAGWLGWQSRSIRSAEPEVRKALVASKVTLRHHAIASFVFATMTIFTFEGMANTWTRTGKLFPGPHLYAGLGLVAAMAATSALVPYMQKGAAPARNAHLAAGVGIVGLFGWQAKSGMFIVGKLLKWW